MPSGGGSRTRTCSCSTRRTGCAGSASAPSTARPASCRERRLNAALRALSAKLAHVRVLRSPTRAPGRREGFQVMRVDWVLLNDAAQAEVEVGDLVSVEAGG